MTELPNETPLVDDALALFDICGLSRITGVPDIYLERYFKKVHGPKPIRIGRYTRWTRQSIAAWLEELSQQNKTEVA